MHIERITDTDYKISIIFKIEEVLVEETIEKIIFKLRKRLKLSGFYNAFLTIRNFGIFLILKKVDNSYYKENFNLKIISKNNLNVYYKTDDYFSINEKKGILYYDGWYYQLLDDSFDVIKSMDFGEFVFGDDVTRMLDKAVIV